jgi:hypothetical protein
MAVSIDGCGQELRATDVLGRHGVGVMFRSFRPPAQSITTTRAALKRKIGFAALQYHIAYLDPSRQGWKNSAWHVF